MRIIDRYLFWNFIVSYLIVFATMVGLYIVIDLFANADEFIKDRPGTLAFVERVGLYYAIHMLEYFGRLSPVITMLAAMSTLASLHRHNEIVALLAAGVPIRRILTPILAGVACVVGLGVANREWAMPSQAEFLQRAHDDVGGKNIITPSSYIDSDQVLIRAKEAFRHDQHVDWVSITLPNDLQDIKAASAYYEVDRGTGDRGWRLVRPEPPDVPLSNKLRRLPNGDLFLVTHVTFAEIIRQHNWTLFASTGDLIRELENDEAKNPVELRSLIHQRLMHPALNLVLVLLGIPFVLQWDRRNVYRGVFIAMLLSGAFFVFDNVAAYFAGFGYLDPAFAAWLPVFFFGPLALGLLHRIGA